jgi:predicted ATPase
LNPLVEFKSTATSVGMFGNIFAFDDFELDVHKGELRRAGVPVRADALVLRLLEVLVRRPGELVTKQELSVRGWEGRAVSDNALTVAIARLRRTLEHEHGACEMLLTVHGRGYRFLRAVEVLESPAQPPTAGSVARAPSPLVGRERVLEHVGAALSEAASGSGGLFVLTGEPGVGKTRVAETLAREATGLGFPVAWGYCRELGHTSPLWAVSGLLRSLIRQSPAARSVLREARFVALVPELLPLLPELTTSAKRPTPGADAIECTFELGSKHRVFDAFTRALTLVAEHTPYVLILDDLQRADTASLELLHYLLPELSRSRILFLATLSGEPATAVNLPLTQVLGHRNCTRISLQCLSETEVANYLVALFGDADPELCRAVFEKSEGNPFFMTELARQIRYHDHPELAALEISGVALQLMRQRIASVDEATRDVLSLAAVIGRSFSLSRLQAVSERDAATLMASLDQAVASDLIRPSRDSQNEFAFTHELLREALCETLAPTHERSCHARLPKLLDNGRSTAKH